MPSHNLPNYLRTYRRRAGISQDDVAFLLGCRCATTVSRYEHYARRPSLRTALACEAIFRAPVSELFSGQFRMVERVVCLRAERLAAQLMLAKPSHRTARRLAFLRNISSAIAASKRT